MEIYSAEAPISFKASDSVVKSKDGRNWLARLCLGPLRSIQKTPNLRAAGVGLFLFLQESQAVSAGCKTLAQVSPDITFSPGSAVYEYEKRNFWSNTQILNPGCVYVPTSAHQVSTAIIAMKSVNGSFAVRGGGHTAISGANSIDGDVLIAFSNMTQLELSAQRSHVQLGPGLRWGEVYNALEPYDLTVAGGRVAPVGVLGLLLAGGIGFYSNKYGFSANTVSSYEVVLVDGRIVNATASNEYSDLFWALKGGGPNFGLVTSFELQTIPSPRVFAGVLQFESSQFEAFFQAVAAYSANIFDAKSHIIPTVGFARDEVADEISSYAYVVLFYDDPDETNPEIFHWFLDIPSVGNTLSIQTVANLAFRDWKSIQSQVPTGTLSSTEVYFQPLGRDFIVASQNDGADRGPLALDESQGTYIVYAIALGWVDSAYDEVISAWIEKTVQEIDSATAEAGLHHPFRYMGDSAAFQVADFFSGYPAGAVERLNSIALKYDPDGFFQKNMPGGFKLSASKNPSSNDAGEVIGSKSYDAGIFKEGDSSVSGLRGFDAAS
ncbi:FAD binding domain protein [Colletotrichum kahawae]|uniref:FAD binding domain protein n=1 Tax=Colletotrichum kahawae TaxID=34407 RepID=A0AAD9YJP7_COLKA|nr:FAD binding domain protein [Colletotrichum kahawae]